MNPSHCFAVEFRVEEAITYPVACIQTALLHTTSSGERRIRVLTLALPVSSNPIDILETADAASISNLFAKNAAALCVSGRLDEARDFLFSRTVDILSAVKAWSGASFGTPEGLRHLAVLSLGAVKSVPFRAGPSTHSDMRAAALLDIENSSVSRSIKMANPRLYSLHYSVSLMFTSVYIIFLNYEY